MGGPRERGVDKNVKEVLGACRRLYDGLDALDSLAARRADVGRNELRCLNFLESGSKTVTALGTHLGLSSGATSLLLDRLEVRGLIERRQNAEDRRSVLVHLTAQAFGTAGQVYIGFVQLLQAHAAELNSGQQEQLRWALERVASICEEAVLQLAPD